MSVNKKIKKRYIDYPTNVPRKLFKWLKTHEFKRTQLAKFLGVNSGRLSLLLDKGIEPTDQTWLGRDARARLFLRIHKHRSFNEIAIHKPRTEQPQFIKEWKHLPTDERHKVIKEYLVWKQTTKK